MRLEYLIIGIYLLFLVFIGVVFKKLNQNTGDYFRSGSQGSWWLVGSSNYMAGTSAVTFTTAAGITYNYGWSVMLVYAFPVWLFLHYFFYAARCRQKRLTTPGEVMRERFNPATQQVYTIIGLLTSFLGSGLWLYTLSIFVATMFKLDMYAVILGLGFVVIFYCLTGGRWAVMAADSLQCLIMFAVAILIGILSLNALGGISGFIERASAPEYAHSFAFFKAPGEHPHGYYTVSWMAALVTANLIGTFSVGNVNYTVKDGRSAKKAQLLTIGLCYVGAAFFFIPPFAARLLYSDKVAMLKFPGGGDPADGSYAIACLELLPPGMIGLIVVAMLAATASSMDASLNTGAANFMLNVYPPLERIFKWRPLSERQRLLVSRVYCLISGLSAMMAALCYTHSGAGPFKVMLTLGALLGLPMTVPMFWGLFLKRVPPWTPIISTAVGFACSIFIGLSGRYFGMNWLYHQQVFTIIGVTTLAVFILWFLYRKCNSEEYNLRVDGFFLRMNTPVDFEKEVGRSNDAIQLKTIGFFSMLGGAFIMLLAVMAQDVSGVVCPLSVGGAIALLGLMMRLAARHSKNNFATLPVVRGRWDELSAAHRSGKTNPGIQTCEKCPNGDTV